MANTILEKQYITLCNTSVSGGHSYLYVSYVYVKEFIELKHWCHAVNG